MTFHYHADRWEFDPNTHTLTRLHKRNRKSLFTPQGTKDMPFEEKDLASTRETFFKPAKV